MYVVVANPAAALLPKLILTNEQRVMAGEVWRKAVLGLKDRNSDVSPAVKHLRDLAVTYKIPSLNFAAEQLSYYRRFGIKSVNFGGTMGCGKSKLAQSLAEKVSYKFIDSDYFHSQSNITKMSKGIGLDDKDRFQFLSDIKDFLLKPGTISTCSVLKPTYRAILAGEKPDFLLQTNKATNKDHWEIETPNYGLLQISALKPYERALRELDDSEKGLVKPREFNGEKHFISVTVESELEAVARKELGILAKQYKAFEEDLGDPWTYLEIDTLRYSDGPHQYRGQEMLREFCNLPFVA